MKPCQIINLNYNYIQNTADSSVLDVFIDGDIVDAPTQELYKNWFGDETSTSYKSFRDTITASTSKRVNIHINSGGGMMADAFAMHDFIEEGIANGKDWHTYGKGMVASAATYPLLAGGKNMHISNNCFFMIHNASGGNYGDVNEMESYAATLRKFNDTARNLYAEKFAKPKETIATWMNKETWWTGEDMVQMGLIAAENCGPAENAITNSIPKEKWPFQNMAILNTINNSIPKPKNKEMKNNKIATAINDAFAKYFTNGVTLQTAKVDDLKIAITDALGLQEDDDTVDPAAITNAFNAAMTGDAFTTAVANAVTNVLATVPKNITDAIATATAGFAKATDVVDKTTFETMRNDIAAKLGTQTLKNTRGKATSEPEAIEETEGITWNVSKD